MQTIGQQKIEPLSVGLIALLIGSAIAVGAIVPAALPWAVGMVAGAVLLVWWSVRWDVTAFAWLWVFSYGLLDVPAWRLELAGFFNMTVPRWIFLGAGLGFVLHFLLHRRYLRWDRAIYWLLLTLVVYFAASAQIAGWTLPGASPDFRTAPYFRFLGSIFLPFVMFFLVSNSVRTENHLRRALLYVSIYGWYALYIGYLQYGATTLGLDSLRQFIWPGYINDPEFGIHFDRARGAFAGASPQAVFLVFLFYVDLYLIRRVRGPYRLALIFQAVLTPPAVFFCLLRSAYLAFLLCGMVWIVFASRPRYRLIKLAMFLLLIVIAGFAMWDRLTSTDRAAGGVAQVGPVLSRQALAAQTWEIFKQEPMVGVGFGHFVEAKDRLELDPLSPAASTYGELSQHNLFLSMLAETGVIGLAGTVLLFVLIFRESLKLYRKLPPTAGGYLTRDFVVVFWVLMVNYLTDAMFRDPLWDVFVNGLFWSYAGLIVAFNRRLDPQPLDLPVAPSLDR